MEKTRILHLEDLGSLRGHSSPLTVKISRWHYYIARVAMTVVEGYYETQGELDEQVKNARHGIKDSRFANDYPKIFQITCRPEDFQELADSLREICKSELNANNNTK